MPIFQFLSLFDIRKPYTICLSVRPLDFESPDFALLKLLFYAPYEFLPVKNQEAVCLPVYRFDYCRREKEHPSCRENRLDVPIGNPQIPVLVRYRELLAAEAKSIVIKICSSALDTIYTCACVEALLHTDNLTAP